VSNLNCYRVQYTTVKLVEAAGGNVTRHSTNTAVFVLAVDPQAAGAIVGSKFAAPDREIHVGLIEEKGKAVIYEPQGLEKLVADQTETIKELETMLMEKKK
jgi:hypothetical protein